MAVKKRKLVADNHSQFDLTTLAAYIQSMNEPHNYLPPQHDMIREAENIVRGLARTIISVEDDKIWEQLQLIEEFLMRMVSSVQDDLRKEIIAAVLETFYSIISDPQSDASPVTSIVLIVFMGSPEESIRSAARWLLAKRESEPNRSTGLRAALSCLYHWAATWRGTPTLGSWTMAWVKELEELEQFDILVEVSTNNVVCLLLALNTPEVLNEPVSNVIFHTMACLRESTDAFDRMAPYIVGVLENLASDSGQWSRQLLQNLVDILTATVENMAELPDFKDKYAEVISCLERHMTRHCQYLLTIPWNMKNWAEGPADKTGQDPEDKKVGLLNLGNTCYMNSVIQALLVTRQFSSPVMTRMHNRPYWCIIGSLFAKMTHSLDTKLYPEELFRYIKPPYFTPDRQHDSFEFLGYVFELLCSHEQYIDVNFDYSRPQYDLSRLRSGAHTIETENLYNNNSAGQSASSARPGTSNRRSTSPRPGGSGASSSSGTKRRADSPPTLRSARKRVRYNTPPAVARNDSFIDKLFGGVLLTRIECSECHISSLSRDVFRDLPLSFPEKPEGQLSVQALLEYFCSTERLCGDNKYDCPQCRGLKDAERSVVVENAPKYLILVLKNFQFESKNQVQNKLMMPMNYNHTVTLPKIRAQGKPLVYNLYATVIHSGPTLDSGHYYTVAKDGDHWYEFNDALVSRCNVNELNLLGNCSTPYILFYRRSDVEEIAAPLFEELPPRFQQTVLSHNKQVVDSSPHVRSYAVTLLKKQ